MFVLERELDRGKYEFLKCSKMLWMVKSDIKLVGIEHILYTYIWRFIAQIQLIILTDLEQDRGKNISKTNVYILL